MIIISYLFFFFEAAYGSPDMIASLFKQLLDEMGSNETRGTCHEDDGYPIFRLFLAHTILKLLFRSRHYCQILLYPENISVYAIVPERIMANTGTSFCLYRHDRNVSMSYAPFSICTRQRHWHSCTSQLMQFIVRMRKRPFQARTCEARAAYWIIRVFAMQ